MLISPLSSAPPTTFVQIAIWIVPEELTLEWDKQPLGDQIVTDVASLLKSVNTWHCKFHVHLFYLTDNNIPGKVPWYPASLATLSITCRISDVLVSSMPQFSWFVIKHVFQIVSDGHDCLPALEEFSFKLYNFGTWSKNVAAVSTKIEVDLARLDLCPSDHAHHTIALNGLGAAYLLHYDQDGNIPDLNRSIDIYKRRLVLCPLGHPEHAEALGALAGGLRRQYSIQKNKKDLNRVIDMQQAWLHFCPLGHSDYPAALASFAISLWERYLVQQDITDLNKAIEMNEESLELWPADHPLHDIPLNNLALCIR